MLRNFIVTAYQTLLEIGIWLWLLTSLIAGWKFYGFKGGLGGLLVGVVTAVLLFGAFLILGDIRDSVRRIESERKGG